MAVIKRIVTAFHCRNAQLPLRVKKSKIVINLSSDKAMLPARRYHLANFSVDKLELFVSVFRLGNEAPKGVDIENALLYRHRRLHVQCLH